MLRRKRLRDPYELHKIDICANIRRGGALQQSEIAAAQEERAWVLRCDSCLGAGAGVPPGGLKRVVLSQPLQPAHLDLIGPMYASRLLILVKCRDRFTWKM